MQQNENCCRDQARSIPRANALSEHAQAKPQELGLKDRRHDQPEENSVCDRRVRAKRRLRSWHNAGNTDAD